MAQHIPKPSTRACRARNLFNWSTQIDWVVCHIFSNKASSLTPDMNWVMSFLHLHTPQKVWISVVTHSHMSGLIATTFHTPHMTLITDQSTANKGVKINLHSSSLIKKCQVHFPYKYQPSSGLSSSLLMKTSCLRLKLVELKLLCKFQCWWSEKNLRI